MKNPNSHRSSEFNNYLTCRRTGAKLAFMTGQGVVQAFVPLPGGATAKYDSTGLIEYRHPDWLGTARLGSSPSRALIFSTAYMPFGETYFSVGSGDVSFTGQNLPCVLLYSRAGKSNWNRYAYANNQPCMVTDPLGLDTCTFNIAIKNPAGVPNGQLNWLKAQIQAVLSQGIDGNAIAVNFVAQGGDATLENPEGANVNVLPVFPFFGASDVNGYTRNYLWLFHSDTSNVEVGNAKKNG